MTAPHPGLVAIKKMVTRSTGGRHQQTFWVRPGAALRAATHARRGELSDLQVLNAAHAARAASTAQRISDTNMGLEAMDRDRATLEAHARSQGRALNHDEQAHLVTYAERLAHLSEGTPRASEMQRLLTTERARYAALGPAPAPNDVEHTLSPSQRVSAALARAGTATAPTNYGRPDPSQVPVAPAARSQAMSDAASAYARADADARGGNRQAVYDRLSHAQRLLELARASGGTTAHYEQAVRDAASAVNALPSAPTATPPAPRARPTPAVPTHGPIAQGLTTLGASVSAGADAHIQNLFHKADGSQVTTEDFEKMIASPGGPFTFYKALRDRYGELIRDDETGLPQPDPTKPHTAKVKRTFHSVYANDGYVKLSGKLVDEATGVHIADWTRSFKRNPDGSVHVHHDFLVFGDEYQGGGAGSAFLKEMIRNYPRMGVKDGSVDAAWIGRYTWARMGFQWEPHYERELGNKFQRFAQHNQYFHPDGSPFTPEHAKALWNAESKAFNKVNQQIPLRRGSPTAPLEDTQIIKKFLISKHEFQGIGWSGRINFTDGDPHYEHMKQYLGLTPGGRQRATTTSGTAPGVSVASPAPAAVAGAPSAPAPRRRRSRAEMLAARAAGTAPPPRSRTRGAGPVAVTTAPAAVPAPPPPPASARNDYRLLVRGPTVGTPLEHERRLHAAAQAFHAEARSLGSELEGQAATAVAEHAANVGRLERRANEIEATRTAEAHASDALQAYNRSVAAAPRENETPLARAQRLHGMAQEFHAAAQTHARLSGRLGLEADAAHRVGQHARDIARLSSPVEVARQSYRSALQRHAANPPGHPDEHIGRQEGLLETAQAYERAARGTEHEADAAGRVQEHEANLTRLRQHQEATRATQAYEEAASAANPGNLVHQRRLLTKAERIHALAPGDASASMVRTHRTAVQRLEQIQGAKDAYETAHDAATDRGDGHTHTLTDSRTLLRHAMTLQSLQPSSHHAELVTKHTRDVEAAAIPTRDPATMSRDERTSEGDALRARWDNLQRHTDREHVEEARQVRSRVEQLTAHTRAEDERASAKVEAARVAAKEETRRQVAEQEAARSAAARLMAAPPAGPPPLRVGGARSTLRRRF